MLRKITAQVEVLVDVLVEGLQGSEALSKMLMVVVIKLLVMMEERDWWSSEVVYEVPHGWRLRS